MKPDFEEYSRKTKDAASSGNCKAALLLKIEYLSRINDCYFAELGLTPTELRPDGEMPPLSVRFGAMARLAFAALEKQGDCQQPQLVASSRISLALSHVLSELEQCDPGEVERTARLLLVGADLGAAQRLDQINELVADGIAALAADASSAGAITGGEKSGAVRRQKAAATWQPHATELAKRAREQNPNASQDDVVEDIQTWWQNEAISAPGPKTLKNFVSKLEKAGEIPSSGRRRASARHRQ